MLPRKHRIPRAYFSKHPPMKRVTGGVFFAAYCYDGRLPSRFACVVSKKNARSSVLRHKIKRYITSYFENFIKNNPNGIQVIVSLSKKIEQFSINEKELVVIDVNNVLSKINHP